MADARAGASGDAVDDVIIVGGGSAGLFAAERLTRSRPGTSVTIVDAGPPLGTRAAATTPGTTGPGGAGLYLGGRLYLGPLTIPVLPPVSPPEGMRPVLAGQAYATEVRAVDALLARLGADAPLRPAPDARLAAAVANAAAVGLEYITSYPSRVLPREQRLSILARLLAELRARGTRLRFATRAEAVERAGAALAVRVGPATAATVAAEAAAGGETLRARAVLLAPGRYGAEWLVGVAGALGARVVHLPVTFGVRLELQAATYAPLTVINPDPRLQLALDGDAVIKTYATCPGGHVAVIERYGTLVASGIPALTPPERGPNATFAALLQPGAAGARARWEGGEALARRVHERFPGRLGVQRLADARAGVATTARALAAGPVTPSEPQAQPGALHDLYPPAYWSALEDLLARITRLAPGADSGDALLYAPAEERFWHVPTDDALQTTARGVFVAGDAPGQTQGAIQAAIAGRLAATGIARYLDRLAP